jgi:uncharacterized protein with FMN-binding domain
MASSKSLSRIAQLAATISVSVASIEEILSSKGLPSPSFHETAPMLPREALSAQSAVLDAVAELQDLLLEPLSLLYNHNGVSYHGFK